MAEQRRIPEVERLESRDMPTATGLAYIAPLAHLGAPPATTAPHVVVLTPTTAAATDTAPLTGDVVTSVPAGDGTHALAMVWQQSAVWQQPADGVFSSLSATSDRVATEYTQRQVIAADAAVKVGAASEPSADAIAATAMRPAPSQAPTITGVLRYAWGSVNRHHVDDRDDAVQQICLEWLLMAATVATTFDDVRRIVARVIDRAYRRLKKQEHALELLDVPGHADPVEDVFRDLQLDRDLGVKDLTDQEWQVVGLRRQGYTFAEIGLVVGMRKQRARELFELAVSYLRKRYCD